jgi:hypothetical protein
MLRPSSQSTTDVGRRGYLIPSPAEREPQLARRSAPRPGQPAATLSRGWPEQMIVHWTVRAVVPGDGAADDPRGGGRGAKGDRDSTEGDELKTLASTGRILRLAATSAALCSPVGAICVSNAAATQSAPVFSGGCEARQLGDVSASELGDYSFLMVQAADRLQATDSPSWDGACSLRIEVQQGDVDSNATDRAEMAGNQVLWRDGESVWYALSFMLDPRSPPPPRSGWMIVDQFFAQDRGRSISGGSPPLSLEIQQPGGIFVKVRGGEKSSEGAAAPRDSAYRLGEARSGTWHEVMIHAVWSTGSNGVIEVWQRDPGGDFSPAPAIVAAGPNVLTVDGDTLPVYAETGIYRSRAADSQVAYYGGLWARPDRTEAEGFFPSPSPASEGAATPPVVSEPSPPPSEVGEEAGPLGENSPAPTTGSPVASASPPSPARQAARRGGSVPSTVRTSALRRSIETTLKAYQSALYRTRKARAIAARLSGSITVTLVGRVARSREHPNAGPGTQALVASGSVKMTSRGAATFTLRLTSAGRALLVDAAHPRLNLVVHLSFLTRGRSTAHNLVARQITL